MQYNLVLDGATFTPRGTDGKLATWVSDFLVGDVPMGLMRVTVSARPPAKGSSIYRISAKIIVPHLAATTDASYSGYVPDNKVSHFEQAEITFLLHEKSIIGDRNGILNKAATLLQDVDSSALRRAVQEMHVFTFVQPTYS